ncbi:Kinase [Balamuthia mandrillaris]
MEETTAQETSTVSATLYDPEHLRQPQTVTLVGAFPHQVAGHGAILKAKGHKICKPLSPREAWFYQTLNKRQPSSSSSSFNTSSSFSPLLRFIPAWYGAFEISAAQLKRLVVEEERRRHSSQQHQGEEREGEGGLEVQTWDRKVYHQLEEQIEREVITSPKHTHSYIVMENLTAHYKRPCLIDIKMGTKTWDDESPEHKRLIAMEKAAKTTTCSLGLRLCGMQVWQTPEKVLRKISKSEGLDLTPETIGAHLSKFFHNGERLRKDVISAFTKEVEALLYTLETCPPHHRFNIYSSSLLFVYEGEDVQEEEEAQPPKVTMKMIDFVHAFRINDEKPNDDGYVFGLRNLLQLLQQLG